MFLRSSLCLLLLSTSAVFAQGPNIQHFRPAMPHQKLVQTMGSQALMKPFAISLFANYVDQPLEFISNGQLNFIESILTYDLNVAVSLGHRLTLGISVPFSTLITPNASLSNLVRDRALGDMVVRGLYTIGQRQGNGLGIAILPEAYLPSGQEDDYMGHTDFGFGGRLIADLQKDRLYASLNIGAIKRLDNAVLANIDIQDQWSLHVGAQYDLKTVQWGGEFVAWTDLTAPFQSEVQSPMEVSSFVTKPVYENLQLYGGGAVGIMQGYGNATWRVYLGLRHQFDKAQSKSANLDQARLDEIKDMIAQTASVKSPVRLEHNADYFTHKHIHFEQGQDDLIPESMLLLRELAIFLQAHPDHRVTLIGHADGTGKHAFNQKLSEQRAEKVKSFLVMEAIDPDRVDAVGKGADMPLVDEKTRYDQLLNRRVEVHIDRKSD